MSTELQNAAGPKVFRPEDGLRLDVFGDLVTIKLGPADTAGGYTVATTETPPGGGPPPHVHAREDELLVVLEGRYAFLANGEWTELGPGGMVFLPKDHPHTFKNVSDGTSKLLVVARPCGFERFMQDCADAFAAGGPPDMAKVVEISERHGIRYM